MNIEKFRIYLKRCKRVPHLIALILSTTAHSATLPTGFVETTVVDGIASPTAMAIAPDGRIFVCSQTGALRVIKNGVLLPQPFVSLPVDSIGERGLLGVAFDPNFTENQFVYLYRTVPGNPPHNRVSRFTADGDIAVAGSEKVLLDLDPLGTAKNHNGGALHFGSDGKLYIAVGDNVNGPNAQTLRNLLGKILRLNPDGTIPSDNPFTQVVGARDEIWAMGLRNPFTFAFDGNKDLMYINDVGVNTYEEINLGQAGANYGWPSTEGPTNNPAFKAPVYYYAHSDGCAITGGAFYSPTTIEFPSSYVGKYFFADYCSGFIRMLDPATKAVSEFATGASFPVDIQVGDDGSLFYLARGTGSLMQISYADASAPVITTQPSSQTVSVGSPVSFVVAASGPTPFSYQWLRNGANISGATSASYTLSSTALADNGARFQVRVTNTHGSKLSSNAVLTVTANRPPTAQILTPVVGTTYSGGMVINYSGAAKDPENGDLPESAFTWQIDFHHDNHLHPFLPATTGSKSGSITIPDRNETSANVFYRLILSAKDSGGLINTTLRDIFPLTSHMTLATNPPSLQILLDGQPQITPQAIAGVVGIKRTIAAPSPQLKNGFNYVFQSWSDGQAASHEISTPETDTTYSANYVAGTSLFTNQTPVSSNQTNGVPYELGMKLKVERAGTIAAIRYFKSPSDIGTHVGNIWSSNGILLASVTFSEESASGWQQQTLPIPLAVQANTVYVVSVNAQYYYPYTNGGLAAPVANGDLTSVAVGDNGVFGNPGAFPTSSFQNGNYFRDVVFVPSPSETLFTTQSPLVGRLTHSISYEMGMKFQVARAGTISAIRYYKSPFDTGTHIGHLWSSNRTLLATVTFTDETASGWQQQALPSPISVQPDTTYVVSVNVAKFFPYTNKGLETSIVNGDLRSVADGSNGVYGNAGSFPTTSYQSSNYFRDIVYTPSGAPPESLLSTQIPVVGNGTNGVPYEMGMKFQVGRAGTITAIRYWKAPSDGGTHVGRIWSSTGTPLAEVTFTGESTSGWQQQSLDQPLAIQADTTYVVSVNIASNFPYTLSGLTNPIVNGDIRSLTDVDSGVFGNPSEYPTKSYLNTNYFRDIVFVPD